MKSPILNILMLAAIGAGAYLLVKKLGCSCKDGKCGCSKKSANAPATVAQDTGNKLLRSAPNNTVVPSSGLGNTIDQAFSPNSTGWHSMDQLQGPVIDTVTQVVPTIGVQDYNSSRERIFGDVPPIDLNM